MYRLMGSYDTLTFFRGSMDWFEEMYREQGQGLYEHALPQYGELYILEADYKKGSLFVCCDSLMSDQLFRNSFQTVSR